MYHTQRSVYRFSAELSSQLDTELAFISLIKPQIKQLELTISCIRNYSTSVTPINTLPLEIITYIFQLVPEQSCQFYQPSTLFDNIIIYPKLPDYLTWICSLWCRIARSSPLLWRHIDLTHCDQWNDGLLARAHTRGSRRQITDPSSYCGGG
ncbi:hypothetical protein B0J17DRAFT_678309 [Rhizoctonia solani]|nr:hypothetical protein B0J17DRAFT_678309 [Rhizoctonia solani]